MGEKPGPYNQLLQTVAEVQDEKGSGGCFMELFREVKSIGAAAYLNQDTDSLQKLGEVVEALPDLQTDEALEEAYEKIDSIREDVGI